MGVISIMGMPQVQLNVHIFTIGHILVALTTQRDIARNYPNFLHRSFSVAHENVTAPGDGKAG